MAFQGVEYKTGTIGYDRVNEQYASSSYKGHRNFCPKAIFVPSSTEDIQVVIKNARDQKIPVALRTGGHHYSGASSTDEKGILLDLKHTFRRPGVDLKLDRVGDKAFLYASVSYKLGEVFDFFKDNGIFMPTGQCREVHVGGHVQSGGFGMLARSIGLLVDWVREITIVNHEGEVVTVTKESEPDLFFGICGGSPGNFGVVTHYKIEVQQDKDYQGSKGMWIAFYYRDNTYKALLDLLRRKAEDPNLPRGYDFTVNVTSRSANLAAVYPGTNEQLKDDLGDVKDPERLEKLLNGKYAMIVCWAQFLNIKGEPSYDPSFFEEIKNVPFEEKKKPIVKDFSGETQLPASQIYTMWFLDKAREFDLPYIKRTYTTKKFTSPDWSEWFQGRVSEIIGSEEKPKGTPGLWISSQIQMYGGKNSMFIKNGLAKNGTAIANRDSIISGTWDAFYDIDNPHPLVNTKNSRPQAEKWQNENDEGLYKYYSETDRRLLWGSWGDWDLSKPEVWKCYYDDETFKKLQSIRAKADPYGTFSYSPFAVPRASLTVQQSSDMKKQSSNNSFMSVAMRPWISVESWGLDRLDLVGIGSDDQMWLKSFDRDAGGWHPAGQEWKPISGKFKQIPAAISWSFGRLDLFGVGLDNQPYHKAWGNNRKKGGSWIVSDWQGIDGKLKSPPVPVSWGNGRIDVFGIGMDDQMYRRVYGGQWSPSGWEALTGKFKSVPAAVSWGPGRIDVFGIGMDDQMYHRAFDNGKWLAGWTPMSGKFKSPPVAVSWGPNRLDVFGIGMDDQMYHKAYNGKDWTSKNWAGISGKFKSLPSACSWGQGRLDVFGIGMDDQMYHKAFDNGKWVGDWKGMKGKFKSAPSVVSWAKGRIDVFGIGTDDAVWQRYYSGNKWSSDWGSMGGKFKTF